MKVIVIGNKLLSKNLKLFLFFCVIGGIASWVDIKYRYNIYGVPKVKIKFCEKLRPPKRKLNLKNSDITEIFLKMETEDKGQTSNQVRFKALLLTKVSRNLVKDTAKTIFQGKKKGKKYH